jgi:long-chain acyl-CoA synthetase
VASDTIVHRLLAQRDRRPSAPAYFVKHHGVWRPTSWRDYVVEIRTAGRALVALGLDTGSTTTILGFNRPEWVIVNVATMGIGGAAGRHLHHLLAGGGGLHRQPLGGPAHLVENEEQWKKVLAERHNLPKLKYVVTMKGAARIADPMVLSWDEFMAKGDQTPESDYLERVHALSPRAWPRSSTPRAPPARPRA